MKRFPVDIIVPDTGPLITLAIADRLALLQSFGRRVLITDVVQKECLSKPASPGFDELSSWLGGKGKNQFQTINTPFLNVYDQLAKVRPQPGERPSTHGLGEASIAWMIANIEQFAAKDAITLVLIVTFAPQTRSFRSGISAPVANITRTL